MKKVGRRQVFKPSAIASGQLLRRGCEVNDALHSLPTGNTTWFPKGVYRYKNFEMANSHWDDCLAKGMASQHGKTVREKDIADRLVLERVLNEISKDDDCP